MKNEDGGTRTLAEELEGVILRAGCRAVAEELGKIGESLGALRAGAASAGVALPAPAPVEVETTTTHKKKKRKKKARHLALPAPGGDQPKRAGRGELTAGIVEVLKREEGALTASEVAERLRSRAFSFDPGVCADKQLTSRVSNCLAVHECFEWAGKHGMGYRLKR